VSDQPSALFGSDWPSSPFPGGSSMFDSRRVESKPILHHPPRLLFISWTHPPLFSPFFFSVEFFTIGWEETSFPLPFSVASRVPPVALVARVPLAPPFFFSPFFFSPRHFEKANCEGMTLFPSPLIAYSPSLRAFVHAAVDDP